METVDFEPLQPSSRAPKLHLPPDINMDSPYAIFSLLFTEDIWEKISNSTNSYAASQRKGGAENEEAERPWKDTTAKEIRVFFGILIYMGVHDSQAVELYWREKPTEGPIHPVRLYMTLVRFQQIKRFLHISTPSQKLDKKTKEWWYKLKPLTTNFRENCQKYYTPDSKVSIDEIMIRFFGRTNHTIKMPNKPIKQGYKVFALAEHGYIWSFFWSSRQYGIEEMFKYPQLTPTGSMVMNLASQLPKSLTSLDSNFSTR
jgi:hypothetical protein